MEVRCWWWPHDCWPRINVDLVVDETPLLKESVDPHDGANVSSQVTSASSASQVLSRVQPVTKTYTCTDNLSFWAFVGLTHYKSRWNEIPFKNFHSILLKDRAMKIKLYL